MTGWYPTARHLGYIDAWIDIMDAIEWSRPIIWWLPRAGGVN